ncbi:MAG: hypothetical protein JRJ05_10720, partial [Deltaproteobacteria bacterium]|nr:hypothetical protein [Deltaproteobacteria bacterium]
PGTAGFVAEMLVFIGAWKSLHAWWAIPGILGAFITAVYVLRAARRIFWGAGPAEEFHDLSDAKGVEWSPLIILGSCIVLFGFMPSLILDFINRATPDYLSPLTELMGLR